MIPDLLRNPYAPTIKKFLFDMLKQEYSKHEPFIDKMVSTISTPKEYEDISKFLLEIYQSGYLTAVDQHREGLEKLGLKANIVSPKQEVKPTIFK